MLNTGRSRNLSDASLIKSTGFSNTKGKTWLPVHENYRIVNLNAQKSANESHYKVYRALTELRVTSDALKFGSLTTDVLNNTVLLVLRKTHKEAVTLLINFSNQNKWKGDLTKTLKGFKDGVVKVASVGSKIQQK